MTCARLLQARRAIVFDLDGTLVDTLPDLAAALDAALAELGAPAVPASLVRRSLHGGLEASALEAVRYLELGDALAAPLADAYARHYAVAPARASRPYPGVAALLERLSDGGARLAVCTNKRLAQAELLLEATGLDRHVEAVIGADSCARRKPDPEPVRLALARLRAAARDALMVGDSIVDVRAAHGAGLVSLVHVAGYGDVPFDAPGVGGRFGSYAQLLAEMG